MRCVYCGTEFTCRKYREDKAKYCSLQCLGKSRRGIYFINSGSFIPNDPRVVGNKTTVGLVPWNKGKTKLTNEVIASSAIKSSKTKLGKKLGKYRTRIDKGKTRKPNFHLRGKNHPNWKGGITTESKKERIRFKKQFRMQVFQRDNYRCVNCGKGGNIQVDHIKPWSIFPDYRFDLDNCRTLCLECHYMVTFGRPMPKTSARWGNNSPIISDIEINNIVENV